ncbi:hypothetical protein, partial [Streptomyces scabiei]|uniref:hypothetical protein n=1 Tax=Streptomyces scabiei TaxID=1930 RepID=UPI0029AACAAA
MLAVQDSGRAAQDFFDGGVGGQALEPVRRAPSAFLLMLGTVRGHAPAEHILRPLPKATTAQGAESDVGQNPVAPVGVVREQDVDRQSSAPLVPRRVQGTVHAARSAPSSVGYPRSRSSGRLPELAELGAGGGPWWGELEGVEGRH